MTEPTAPPAGGGNLMYGIIGGVLIVAAISVWFGMRGCEEPPSPVPPTLPDAGTEERPTSLVEDELVIPEPEPDAGPAVDAGQRIRYVTRYVGGGGGSWSCSGSIDPSAARQRLSRFNLQFRNCYERRLKVNNTLEGRVTLQMRVGRSGAVSGVRTGGSLRDAQVLSCVRNIAQRITFPSPRGGCAVVSAPFNFTPRR